MNEDFTLDSLSDSVHADTKELLNKLKEQSKKSSNITEQQFASSAKNAIKVANENLDKFKKIVNNGNLKSHMDEMVDLTNPNKVEGVWRKYESRVYRTEIITQINDYLIEQNIDHDIASNFMLKAMEAYAASNQSTKKSLKTAMNAVQQEDLIPDSIKRKFLHRIKRNELAEEMNNGENSEIKNKIFTFDTKKIRIKQLQLIVGGAMVGISPDFLNGFKLQNIIKKDGIYLACINNGNTSNFVVIQEEEIIIKKSKTKEKTLSRPKRLDPFMPPDLDAIEKSSFIAPENKFSRKFITNTLNSAFNRLKLNNNFEDQYTVIEIMLKQIKKEYPNFNITKFDNQLKEMGEIRAAQQMFK